MRDFSWKVFTMSGDIDAYMLFKESKEGQDESQREEDESISDEAAEPY